MLDLSAPDNGPPGNKSLRMSPPEAAQLIASLGGNLSTSTREAIEAAPVQLRSAFVCLPDTVDPRGPKGDKR